MASSDASEKCSRHARPQPVVGTGHAGATATAPAKGWGRGESRRARMDGRSR